ncbi:MAG: MarR family transcriptional regulator [Anaerolineae bacterium]|nr:MarR family transcriptional regulator [Anaerolineae bacterium]
MGTHYQGTQIEKDALDVYIKLSRAAESVEARVNCHLKDYGLTWSQFGVLESLYHLGPLHQQELAAKILKSSGNLTLVIDNLVKRGLVERERDESDRRFVTICLTERGRQLIDQIFPDHVKNVVKTIAVLTPKEQHQLAALCRKLGLAKA